MPNVLNDNIMEIDHSLTIILIVPMTLGIFYVHSFKSNHPRNLYPPPL